MMRTLAFSAALAASLALAAAAQAQPAAIAVTVDPAFADEAEDLGQREVDRQIDRLSEILTRALAETPALAGARIELTITDLRPNRPTVQQTLDRPGLDPIRSQSIGGAAIEGQIITADGEVIPVSYAWFSSTLADVRGVGIWGDADRAFRRLAANLDAGRYERR
jgi:hypothetical protein